ncbi:MAG: type II toxin-antitoxin system HicB family antitoxin [Spirochaetaceae bacterium]|nr:type II toxin-antitoxin system HicB family antitoxin [Spirochaetaceae bacterium]
MPPVPSIVTRAELTAVIERDGDGYVALCPEVDVASEGNTVQEARTNLEEAVGLFFETASDIEVKRRIQSEVYVTRIQVPVRVTQPNAMG